MNKQILIVDDEITLVEALEAYLRRESFQLLNANNVQTAQLKIKEKPDLIILDWMLPDGHGIDLLKKWRQDAVMVPIIFLSARADLIDKVLALELGANDYLTKPFEPRELLARIHVQLRPAQNNSIKHANIRIQPLSREVFYYDQKIDLTKTEYQLLNFFLENPNQVFSREELLKQVWGYNKAPTTRTVDNHILQLRQKTHADLFETMHGIGYRFITFTNL